MIYEEKFVVVVKAIEEARKITPPKQPTKLKLTYENELQHLDLDDTRSILYQLQDEHGVITILKLANTKFVSGLDPWAEEQDYFLILVRDKFKKWSNKRLGKDLNQPLEKQHVTEEVEVNDKPRWSKNFKWEGNTFVFGNYGRINFNSKQRISLFHKLTETEGHWVTVRKLKEATEKNDSYVRPTLGQIERSMESGLKKNISIPSTEEDNLQPKPQEGAYRIKFTPKSL